MKLVKNLKESQVTKIWQQLANNSQLVAEGGELLTIIYPGRINDDRGADFRDAVIATSNGVEKGDIEVHVKSSDWQAHRHQHDPVYNRVILHVVMWHNTGIATRQSGQVVPILALHKYLTNPASQYQVKNMPCRRTLGRSTDSVMAQFLDTAGEERFLAKAAKFHTDLAETEASQCLYQGIMMALGYSKNKAPFLELARRLPLQILESIARKTTDEESLAQQQALLLGTAGLLPSQRQIGHRESDLWVEKLESLWACFSVDKVMSCHDWHLFKVRPNNFPTRRLVAMSYLVTRYKEKGIFSGLVNMIRGLPANKNSLEERLLVTAGGYWASHFDFGCKLESPTLVGRNRAADIIVNVLLPFTFAWGKLTSQPRLWRNAIDFYHHYPRLVENAIERHMRSQLGLSCNLVNSAQRQQGLIHIYKTLCTQGRCKYCRLS